MTEVLGPADGSLIRRVRKAASSFRASHPLTQSPWEASSYPLAANIDGRPTVKTLIWYPGPGCTWSEAGGCLMCNFGESERGETDSIELLARHLLELDPATEHIHIGPGGSFYDDVETPPGIRPRVFSSLERFVRLRTVGIETRPNLVRPELLRATLRQLPADVDRLILGFGLECWDDFVREVSVNKGYNRSAVVRAAAAVAQVNSERAGARIEFETYVLLKPTLLTEREAIEEALRTIDWSFRIGAGTTALFINTIKTSTVQGHLADRSDLSPPVRYQTPYLRSAVEVLRRLPADYRARTTVLGLQSGVTATIGPRACDRCAPFLLGALYAHSFTRDVGVIETAARSWCPCRAAWKTELATPEVSTLHQRAWSLVEALSVDGYV